ETFLRERARDAGAVVFADKMSGRSFKRVRRADISALPTKGSIDDTCWIVRTQSGEEFQCKYLVGADGANSAIARKLAGPLPPAEMEVAFGYRAPLPETGEAATVVAFLPHWVGYAWAFP